MRLTVSGLAAERGGRPVFSGLSFSAVSGELIAVSGPNGAGKSTLLRVVSGLLHPVSGSVRFDPPDEEAARLVHYVGHADALKPALSVAENLGFWRQVWRGTGLDPEAALDRMGLAHLASLPAGVLSAGQKRRVALARLLLASRPIWLLDEPATALDSAGQAGLGGLLSGHLATGGIALVATHQALPLPASQEVTLGKCL